MSVKHKHPRPAALEPSRAGRRLFAARYTAMLTAVLILLLAGAVWWPLHHAGTRPPLATPLVEFSRLNGKWQRPDGGYVVEVKGVEGNGRMDAAYYNPRPIHVARAQAAWENARLRVFIELRDVNYPGSTYNLIYDPPSDQLQGIYYQAALGESYEVFFVRAQ